MIDWFSTACCLYGTRLKSEGRPYAQALASAWVRRGGDGIWHMACHMAYNTGLRTERMMYDGHFMSHEPHPKVQKAQ
jgi:hypothetical protein